MGEDALIAAVLAEDSERRVCGRRFVVVTFSRFEGRKNKSGRRLFFFQGNHPILSMYGIFI